MPLSPPPLAFIDTLLRHAAAATLTPRRACLFYCHYDFRHG